MALTFIRYRINTSARKGTWEYMRVPAWCGEVNLNSSDDRDQIEELILDKENYDPDPQHYRGVDIEAVYCLPGEWLRTEIAGMQNRIDELTRLVEQYRGLL